MNRLSLLLPALGTIASCSLINSFDDVKPAATPSSGGTSGSGGGSSGSSGQGGMTSGGTGGATSGGSGGASVDAGDASMSGGTSGGGTSGTGGTKPGSGGSGGAPKDSGADAFTPGGVSGAIVVYDNSNMKSRLWVLDPKDFSRISLEEGVTGILGIAYDTSTDFWYFFDQAASANNALLVVRQLEVKTGRWRDHGVPVTVPLPASSIAVLNGKIGYLSTPNLAADQGSYTLTVLDTENPALVRIDANQTAIGGTSLKLGLVGSPSAGSVIGGTLTIALEEQAAGCGANACNLDLLRVTVGATSVQADTYDLSSATGHSTVGQLAIAGGYPGLTYDSQGRADVLILPPVDGTAQPVNCSAATTTSGTAQKFKTNSTHDPLTSQPTPFTMGSLRVSSAAFDSCDDVAFATSLSEQRVWAIPFDVTGTVTPGTICVTEAGAALAWEPFNHELLRIAQSGTLEAYALDDSTPTAPAISSLKLSPPVGFSASSGVFAVRLTAVCTP